MAAQQTVTPTPADAPHQARRRPPWAFPIVVVALLMVAAALVVGVLGLFGNPVRSTNADGTVTLAGTFEPYQCNPTACDGYVQAGARSVFVELPMRCPPPQRGAQVTVVARPAPDLGKGSYRATACA